MPFRGVSIQPVPTSGETRVPADRTATDFEQFVSSTERGLRQALTGALGSELGREAAAEALVYAWENWERVGGLANPAGYLYRVGLNWGRRTGRRSAPLFRRETVDPDPWYEPGLPEALARLSEHQRVVLYLVHGHEWSLGEVAALLGVSKGTVQTHLERGLTRLRRDLKVEDEH
jgi:RNA polymerase sigma-70 factor (ECF subfamily)